MKLFWAPIAVEQVRECYEYWNERNQSKSYSQALEKARKLAEKRIKKNPSTFVKTDLENIRIYVVSHFKIFYEVKQNEIHILAFFDSRQDEQHIFGRK